MGDRLRNSARDHAAIAWVRKCCDVALDLACGAHAEWAQFHAEGRSYALDRGELRKRRRVARLAQNGYAPHAWGDLLEYFQPFHAQPELGRYEACRVAARSRQALHDAHADRVGYAHEHDRHTSRRLLQR